DAGAHKERPQHLARFSVIGPEPAVARAREHETPGGCQCPALHRQRRLDLPFDFAGIVIDGGDVAELLLAGDYRSGTAEPEPAARIGRALDVISLRYIDIDGVDVPEFGIDRHWRPPNATTRHACTLRSWQRPHAFLRHHR